MYPKATWRRASYGPHTLAEPPGWGVLFIALWSGRAIVRVGWQAEQVLSVPGEEGSSCCAPTQTFMFSLLKHKKPHRATESTMLAVTGLQKGITRDHLCCGLGAPYSFAYQFAQDQFNFQPALHPPIFFQTIYCSWSSWGRSALTALLPGSLKSLCVSSEKGGIVLIRRCQRWTCPGRTLMSTQWHRQAVSMVLGKIRTSSLSTQSWVGDLSNGKHLRSFSTQQEQNQDALWWVFPEIVSPHALTPYV